MNAIPGNNGVPAVNVGAVIASSNPGDISGSAALPANSGNIMQNMFAEMNLEPLADKPATPASSTPQQNSIILPDAKKETIQIDSKEPDVSLFTEEPKEEVEIQSVEDDEPDMSDIPDDPKKSENWKKAREAIKTERKSLKTLTKELETVKSRLEKYDKGEIVPEIITAKDTKIAQLEKYETIVNGRLSEEYQELVAKPVTEKSATLSKLAQDYEVPENIKDQLIKKIVETENEKERNALITRYFPDAIGATKVEKLVKEMHELGQVAIEMETKPAETMQSLQSAYQAKKQEEAEIIASEFEGTSKVAWNKALEKTAKEKLFPELILDSTNSEHNKIAEKNQHRAAIQYGAAVKKLHQNGLKTLPEDLAVGLARSIQLSIGAVGIAKQLQAAQARIAELEGTNGMIAAYMRPGVNSNGHARAPVNTNDKGPVTPQQAGQAALAVFRK